jgi:putative ABC transport system permease protein
MKLAVRRLLSRPGYTALLVLIIAVGIGAATSVFSVVDQLLLRPPPFAFADRLVGVLDLDRASGGGGNNLTPTKIVGWQAQRALFERFEAYAPMQFDITGDSEPERITGELVSVGLFSMLGIQPRLGRDFTTGDGRPGSDRIVIISHDLWQRRFGVQPDVLGSRIVLNEQDYTVVGVMPRRFKLQGDKDSVWLPVDLEANRGATDATLRSFFGFGRLAPGISLARAKQAAKEIATRLQQETPLAGSWNLSVEKKEVAYVDRTTRTALFVLLGAVSFVLFITCANVANLFLSHAPLRLREMAICSALGSGRGRLIRGVLAETLLIAGAGGALGLLFAQWGVGAMIAAAPEGLAYWSTTPVEVDGRVVVAAVALTAITGIVIGLLPAIRGSRGKIDATLRASSSAVRSSYGRTPAALVVFEVAFSVVLLVGAALMARTLANLQAIDPGFDPDGLVAMQVNLPADRYVGSPARTAFFDTLLERLKATPGISDAALAYGTPPGQGGFSVGYAEVENSRVAAARTVVPRNTVSPEYFRTLRIPLVAGHSFKADDPEDSTVISQGLADRLWPAGGAVGSRFRLNATWPWLTVIGVAANVESREASGARTVLQMYDSWLTRRPVAAAAPSSPPRRRTFDRRVLIVRAENPIAAIPEIKRQIWAIDSKQPIERAALVADLYGAAFGRQRFVLELMGTFSLIALALTAAGIFGVLSQIVMRRTREIGIRMVLGARPSDVMRQVLRSGLMLSLLGAALGIVAALSLARTLRALLFGITPSDPLSFIAVALFLVAVALVACWLPARAAMRIEPAEALRVE